jgi:hypothetical protein
MSDGNTPATGLQTIEQRLDAVIVEPETVEAGTEESANEEANASEAVDKAEGDEPEASEAAKTEATDDPKDGEGEEPQVLTVDEYGDVLVDLNGEKVTLSEVVKGTLRQSDYTRKTQELASARKELDAKAAQVAEIERLALAKLAEAEGDGPEPDWDKLFEDDPIEAPKIRYQWEKKQQAKTQARQQLAVQQQQALMQVREQTKGIALEKFPDWQKPEAYGAGEADRRALALEAGFSEQEYAQAVDYRFAVLLEYARLGKQKADAAAAVEKRVTRPAQVLKPGATKTTAEVKDANAQAIRRKLARPMSIEDRLKLVMGE